MTAPSPSDLDRHDPQPPRAPRIVAERYQLGNLLGSGSSASVYAAVDLRLNRPVTVKLFDTAIAHQPGSRARFEQQMAKAARLRHPHIVAVLDAGFAEVEGLETPFVVTEPAGPLSLRALLDREQSLPPEEVLRFGEQLAAALAYAHQQGIIHANLKPENVLVDPKREQVKLADFALSFVEARTGSLTADTLLRRAAYLAPEQVSGEPIAPTVDVYGLGVVLYELLAGRPPFVGLSPRLTAERRVYERARPASLYEPSIPPAVETVIARALERRVERRWPSMEQLGAALAKAVVDQPGSPRARGRREAASAGPGRGSPWGRSVRAAFGVGLPILGAVLAFLLAVSLIGSMLNGLPSLSGLIQGEPAPDLIGMSVAEAEAAARAKGLDVVVIGERPSDRLAQGLVVQQSPVAGRATRERQAVRITVSAGVTVPDVRGLLLPNATETLNALGWKVARVERSPRPGNPGNSVVLQHPPPGELVSAPGEILLAVAE
jgi:serine/threonine-protein kinase